MEFNRSYCEAEIGEIGQAMGLDVKGRPAEQQADSTIDAVGTLFASIGIPKTIADLGVSKDQLPQVAEQAMGSARLIKNNPRPLDLASMTVLVEAAFSGNRDALRADSRLRKAS
jgi:alcohol dehydrogenase